MKSCRGTLGKRNNWFFIHPPNDFKTTSSQRSKLLLVSDVISSKYISKVDLETKPEWEAQLDLVNLNSHSLNWLQERNETVVVAFNLDKTPCGAAMQAFRSFLMQTKNKRVFDGCGVILFNNGSHNYEDIFPRIFEEGRKIFKSRHLTTFTSRHRLSMPSLRTALKSICRNPSAITFITCANTEFDLRKSVCLLPKEPLQFCSECGSFHDQKTCPCFQGKSDKRMGVSATSLPVSIGAFGSNSSCVMDTTFYTSDYINEGNLKVQITALVKGSDHIKGAENVCVRIHSECLTGDVFYSQKCDCGEQKTKFLHIMQEEEVGVFVYIKGHEGRGAGLLNKIKAYEIVDNESSKNHVDALLEVGCQSDIRGYDAAVNFLKETLQVKSLRLFSNNPKKHEAVKRVFGSNCLSQPMPSVPGKHNEKYLKEKVLLCGHDGLLD